MTDAAIMTARMISITSIGGLVGVWPKTYVSTNTPKLPHNPRPTPPYRLPIKMQASTTANSRQLTKVSIGHSFVSQSEQAARDAALVGPVEAADEDEDQLQDEFHTVLPVYWCKTTTARKAE